jgi:hypothetical protein
LCDTGAILDYLVASAPDHAAFRDAIERARARYLPSLVLAEIDYFLRRDPPAMRGLVDDMRRGAFTLVPSSVGTLARAMEIDRRFADLGLGLVDASIVAAAEDLGVKRVLTRDVRHFRAVRLKDGSALEIVVEPTQPDGAAR